MQNVGFPCGMVFMGHTLESGPSHTRRLPLYATVAKVMDLEMASEKCAALPRGAFTGHCSSSENGTATA
jgi:hypothetical protein